jgi:hypothetical protein
VEEITRKGNEESEPGFAKIRGFQQPPAVQGGSEEKQQLNL